MSDLFLDNKYSRCYFRLMERSRTQVRGPGMERHHIVPRSLGGSNSKTNIVSLTFREHFIAHHLLTKFTAGAARTAMLRALSCMRCSRKGRGLTARQFEVSRWALGEATRGKPSPLKGRPKSDETKARMSAAWANRTPEYFEKLKLHVNNRSAETREKLRQSATNLSDETRRKRSEAAKGRKHSQEHCEKISRRMMGHKNGVGRVQSEATKAKIGEKSRNRSPETLAKMSQIRKDWWAAKKSIEREMVDQ